MGSTGKKIVVILAIVVIAALVVVALMFTGIIPNPLQNNNAAVNTNTSNITVAPISNANKEDNANANTSTHIPDMNENKNNKQTLKEYVYVLNKDGKPLMPTVNRAKVRILLKEGRAKVVKLTPFTIQLLYDTPDRDAAMIMAIVADQMGKPLNELRFKSIKEVK